MSPPPTPLGEYLNNLPQLQDNDQRAALYADLYLLKTTNPEGYKQHVETWKQMILQATRKGVLAITDSPKQLAANESEDEDEEDKPTVTEAPCITCLDASKLAYQFTFKGDRPTSIDVVLREMTKTGGDLVEYDEFMKPKKLMSPLFMMDWFKWASTFFLSATILFGDTKKLSWFVTIPVVKVSQIC